MATATLNSRGRGGGKGQSDVKFRKRLKEMNLKRRSYILHRYAFRGGCFVLSRKKDDLLLLEKSRIRSSPQEQKHAADIWFWLCCDPEKSVRRHCSFVGEHNRARRLLSSGCQQYDAGRVGWGWGIVAFSFSVSD